VKRAVLLLAGAALLIAADEPKYQSSPPRRTIVERRDWGPWGGPFRAGLVPALMQDFGERYVYAAANAALPPPARSEQRIVFLGDSITDGWDLARAFPGKHYINRGIGAQVTAQMLLRFEQDVVALKPAAVVILGGTNDVSGFLQIETPATILANITAMTDIADARGIAVVLCALLPVNGEGENRSYLTRERPNATLRAINAQLRALAVARGYPFVDYAAPLTDARGMLIDRYTSDGLHPNAAGYARMTPVVQRALTRVRVPRPRAPH
jgi:lysophospholipase L1-like esterase